MIIRCMSAILFFCSIMLPAPCAGLEGPPSPLTARQDEETRPAEEDSTFRDPSGAFTVTFPALFKSQYDDKTRTLTLINDDNTMRVAITSVSSKGMPGNNVQQLISQYPVMEEACVAQVEQSGFRRTYRKKVNFQGIPALDYGLEMTKNTGIIGDFLLFINRDNMYMLVFCCSRDNYEANLSLFKKIVNSMRF